MNQLADLFNCGGRRLYLQFEHIQFYYIGSPCLVNLRTSIKFRISRILKCSLSTNSPHALRQVFKMEKVTSSLRRTYIMAPRSSQICHQMLKKI